MDDIIAALQGDRAPGLYRITSDLDMDELSLICQERNLQLFVLDGDRITNKAEFLTAAAQAMQFPYYFGHNWDAFEDCITDLDWLAGNGYVLLYTQPERFATAQPSDWSTLIDILQSAVKDWQQTDTPLYVFFKTNQLRNRDLEEL